MVNIEVDMAYQHNKLSENFNKINLDYENMQNYINGSADEPIYNKIELLKSIGAFSDILVVILKNIKIITDKINTYIW